MGAVPPAARTRSRSPYHRLLAVGTAGSAAGMATRRVRCARGLGSLCVRRRRCGAPASWPPAGGAVSDGGRRPEPSALDRAAFGLPQTAVVVLVSFNLASSFERKNPLAAISAFRSAFGDRGDRILLIKVGNREHAPDDFARIVDAIRARQTYDWRHARFPSGPSRIDRRVGHRAVAASQ